MKTCSKCHLPKPESEFYCDSRKRDGLYPHCKACHVKMTSSYSHTDKGHAVQRHYWLSSAGRTKQRERAHTYSNSQKGKETTRSWWREHWRKYYDRTSPKQRAHSAINNAVRRGKMPPASTLICTQCGRPAAQYHHHHGYAPEHALDVIPLCTHCHRLADA